MTRAYIGLGANLGEPVRTVSEAMLELDRLPRSTVTQRSSLYRTAPVGGPAQPDYVNAVVGLDTELEAEPLLEELQALERRHGRTRSVRNAPRSLDLDLLLYGEARIATPRLAVPHPRMHQRAFVLRPLAEIAPDALVPGRGAVRELLSGCAEQSAERID